MDHDYGMEYLSDGPMVRAPGLRGEDIDLLLSRHYQMGREDGSRDTRERMQSAFSGEMRQKIAQAEREARKDERRRVRTEAAFRLQSIQRQINLMREWSTITGLAGASAALDHIEAMTDALAEKLV